MQNKKPFVGRVWIFSGTAHFISSTFSQFLSGESETCTVKKNINIIRKVHMIHSDCKKSSWGGRSKVVAQKPVSKGDGRSLGGRGRGGGYWDKTAKSSNIAK